MCTLCCAVCTTATLYHYVCSFISHLGSLISAPIRLQARDQFVSHLSPAIEYVKLKRFVSWRVEGHSLVFWLIKSIISIMESREIKFFKHARHRRLILADTILHGYTYTIWNLRSDECVLFIKPINPYLSTVSIRNKHTDTYLLYIHSTSLIRKLVKSILQ